MKNCFENILCKILFDTGVSFRRYFLMKEKTGDELYEFKICIFTITQTNNCKQITLYLVKCTTFHYNDFIQIITDFYVKSQ